MYDYIRFKVNMLTRLKPHYGTRVYHRGYHRPFQAWDVDNKIDEQVTGINHIGGKGHIFDQITQSELVIFDYLGPASLRDTLRMNVVFDPACHEMNPEFLPWFNKLRNAGIYHSDLDSMESEFREIANLGSARRWWNEPARRAVVKEFKQEFNLVGCRVWSWRRFLTGEQMVDVN